MKSLPAFQARWEKLNSARGAHLTRARLCSALTLPSLLPPEGADDNTELPTPYNSHGARCVNNLAAKLWLTLFPPNTAFFRLSPTPELKNELESLPNSKEVKTGLETALAQIENTTLTFMSTQGIRPPLFKALKHLIVTGNVLIYMPPARHDHHPWNSPSAGLKVFRLDQYVCARDPMGQVLEIVIKEPVSIAVLPEYIQTKVQADRKRKPEDTVDLFTRIWLEDGMYHIIQECSGQKLEESYGTYPAEFLPWLALCWDRIGNYGDGIVGEYLGDFSSSERLNQAVVEGSEALAKIIFLCSPHGVTNATDVTEARNLDVISGKQDDIGVVQAEKRADFQTVQALIDKYEQRLGLAFLLNSSIQRHAERVTAEEIQYMAKELEDGLGGQYSVLSQVLQLPIVRLLLKNLMETQQVPMLPMKAVFPVITSGLEALGRTHEQARLREWVADCQQVLGPDEVKIRIKADAYMKKSGSNYGVADVNDLIKDEEEVAQEQQMNQMNAVLAQSAPNISKGIMDYGKEAIKQQQQQ